MEVGRSDDTGLTLISAAGTYYQRIYDLSKGNGSKWNDVRGYYDFPYKTHPTLTTLQLSAPVPAMTFRRLCARGPDTSKPFEIDPAILTTGKVSHPEKPYDNPRAHAVVNDARSFPSDDRSIL